jgi:hypothetical protein
MLFEVDIAFGEEHPEFRQIADKLCKTLALKLNA